LYTFYYSSVVTDTVCTCDTRDITRSLLPLSLIIVKYFQPRFFDQELDAIFGRFLGFQDGIGEIAQQLGNFVVLVCRFQGIVVDELPIGSGMIESGHRHVLQQRIERAGTWWTLLLSTPPINAKTPVTITVKLKLWFLGLVPSTRLVTIKGLRKNVFC
jgi:hypothetical protein